MSTTQSGEKIQHREDARSRALAQAAGAHGANESEGDDLDLNDSPLFRRIEGGSVIREDANAYINQMRAKASVTEYLIQNKSDIETSIRKFLGAAAPYLDDDKTIEITRNPDGQIWIKQLGGKERPLQNGRQKYRDASRLCQEVAASGGLSFTPDEPHLEYIVPFHGARFTATLMPIMSGVMWRIRKRIAEVLYLKHYFDNEQIMETLYKRLLLLIRQNKNILIVAPQGAGKTTVGNAILNTTFEIYPDTRFAILEDTPEIQCVAPNRYEMLTCDRLGFTFGRLIPMQLRYGAHSVTMGEVRASALSLLEMWRTGTTRTGVATIHGENEYDAMARIEDILIKERFEVNPRSIWKSIGGIVVLKPVPNGLPRITNVTWPTGHNGSEYLFEPMPRATTTTATRQRRSTIPVEAA